MAIPLEILTPFSSGHRAPRFLRKSRETGARARGRIREAPVGRSQKSEKNPIASWEGSGAKKGPVTGARTFVGAGTGRLCGLLYFPPPRRWTVVDSCGRCSSETGRFPCEFVHEPFRSGCGPMAAANSGRARRRHPTQRSRSTRSPPKKLIFAWNSRSRAPFGRRYEEATHEQAQRNVVVVIANLLRPGTGRCCPPRPTAPRFSPRSGFRMTR